MAMYFYASKISAIACATRCKKSVLQKSRGQRDRDKDKHREQSKCPATSSNSPTNTVDIGCNLQSELTPQTDVDIFSVVASNANAESMMASCGLETVTGQAKQVAESEPRSSPAQLSAHNLELELELGLKHFERATAKANALPIHDDNVQCDLSENQQNPPQCDNNIERSIFDSADIMYTNKRIVSGHLDSVIKFLLPEKAIDLDQHFVFSFLLSSRLFLHPHELFAKLISSVTDSLESLVAVLTVWTQQFPYDYRDERMMNHVKHIAARCSNSHLEALVSQVLSALLKRLTDLEQHEADLRACHISKDKTVAPLNCTTASQYAQLLCRLEKKFAKQIGPEEFVQCSSLVVADKEKNWNQTSISVRAPGVQDLKKTCNLEAYLEWSPRLRLLVCNEILQCSEAEERSRMLELWSGVSQYCLLVGNYNSATAILEALESPAIVRLQITWSKLKVTWQQLDCMQRHAEGHGHLWQKQAIILNERHEQQAKSTNMEKHVALTTARQPSSTKTSSNNKLYSHEVLSSGAARHFMSTAANAATLQHTKATERATSCGLSNDWVVIPVFADIVKLALTERVNCLKRQVLHLPNGHIDLVAFDRMAAIVGAFIKHMQSIKSSKAPASGECENFAYHMQETIKLGEADLMTASFKCEPASSAEELK